MRIPLAAALVATLPGFVAIGALFNTTAKGGTAWHSDRPGIVLNLQSTAAPEPSTAVHVILGAALVVGIRRVLTHK